MADFDLTQTDAQVQSILNDGQNMQGAGAQTTLTTESVLLKDVNGNYHKILKSSFTEAIRDTLAGLLVNNDKGTTINQIAAIASGDFGSITPANLASFLGGVKPGGELNVSANDIKYSSAYSTVGYGLQRDCPANWGELVTIATGGIYACLQMFHNNGNIWFRRFSGGDTQTWGNWQGITLT